MMPAQKPGSSKQHYGTPRDFLAAVEGRFGELDVDLACTEDNRKAPAGYCWPAVDALAQPWAEHHPAGNLWLNPEYADLATWAKKCATEGALLRRGRILMLTPASIGSNWYAEFVHPHAYVLALSPRLTFEGETKPYPKDCVLSVFGAGLRGFETWRWRA